MTENVYAPCEDNLNMLFFQLCVCVYVWGGFHLQHVKIFAVEENASVQVTPWWFPAEAPDHFPVVGQTFGKNLPTSPYLSARVAIRQKSPSHLIRSR